MKIKIILFFFLCPLMIFSQAITYVNSSTGLSYPDWEGGMSEYEFADMNGDGKVDIISVGDHGCPNVGTSQHGIMVWFGDGTGNWSVQMTGDLGYGGIAVGDVNNDGFPDVGYGIHHNYSSSDLGDQILEVALGNGTGANWTAWDDGLATNGEDWGMFGCDFGDIDNDGDLDLGSISFGCCAGVHIYKNHMDGTWTQSFGFLNGNSNMRFEFGDINNDGYADFTTSSQYGAVYFGDGTGNFLNATGNLPSPGNLGYSGPSLGDVNNNGGKDIAFSKNGGVQVWTYNSVQNQWVNISGTLPMSGQYEETELEDMNSDGYTDVCAYGGGTFTLWLGNENGNWTQETQFTTTGINDCKAFRAGGDVDHNGFPDIVLLAEGGSWPNYQNHMRCYKEASPADSLWIRGLFPKGNETFYQNSVQFINWVSEVPVAETSLVRLELSTSGLGGEWDLIADNLPDNGSFQWTIPMEYSDDCYLQLTVNTTTGDWGSAIAGPFTITGIPVLNAEFSANPLEGYLPLEVLFTDLSAGDIIYRIWDFQNDGIPDSFEQNPVFIYQEPGLYSVTLKVSDGVAIDSITKENLINVLIDGMVDMPETNNQVSVYPNPFRGKAVFNCRVSETCFTTISIVDLTGRELIRLVNSIQETGLHKVSLDGSIWPAGIYYYNVTRGDERFTGRLVIIR